MWKDPIIEALRETRAKMLEEAGGDIREYVRRLAAETLVDPKAISSPEKTDSTERGSYRR